MRGLHFSTAICLFSVALSAADNPFLGTWKLNTAKSQFNPGPAPKSLVVKFEPQGDQVRRTANGTDAEGKPIMRGGEAISWDGKDYPIKMPGDVPMTIAVKRVNDHRNDVTIKHNGKVIITVLSVVSKNGQTMTNTIKGEDEKGEKFHNVEVLDRQ